jgi:hypothetical protein
MDFKRALNSASVLACCGGAGVLDAAGVPADTGPRAPVSPLFTHAERPTVRTIRDKLNRVLLSKDDSLKLKLCECADFNTETRRLSLKSPVEAPKGRNMKARGNAPGN